MFVRVKVTGVVEHGDQFGVVGADPAIGGWDLEKALPLETDESSYPVWTAKIPLQKGGSHFKLLIIKNAGGFEWEPIDGDRVWPEDVHDGYVLEMKYGVRGKKVSPSPLAGGKALEARGPESVEKVQATDLVEQCSRPEYVAPLSQHASKRLGEVHIEQAEWMLGGTSTTAHCSKLDSLCDSNLAILA